MLLQRVLLILFTHTHFFLSACAAPANGTLKDQFGPSSSGQSSIATISVPASNSIPALTSSSFTSDGTFSSTPTSPPSITSVSSAIPTQMFTSAAQQDIDTIHTRRLSAVVGSLSGSAMNIPAWTSSLGSDGKWPDSEVDYTTGCAARRANWPAQVHWQRIVLMAAAWHGGLVGAEPYVKDNTTRATVSRAMDYWFSRDFTNLACLDSGGTTKCPCTNTENSLWNTNWFSNVILIPKLVGQSCILLDDTLTPTQAAGCAHITGRSYDTFERNLSFLTGANTLDVASIGIDLALLTINTTVLTDAYRRIHLESSIRDGVKADGIRADGSFGQHAGLLYNGNYGKDYANAILNVEIEAGGTQFAANATLQAAFATLLDGGLWMIYRNALTNVLHWDFSVLSRFISFPVIDAQATANINMNLTQVRELGQLWSSSSLINFAESLSRNTSNANAGSLRGNRMFYTNDYMVHRGRNYVTTLKMYSTRTANAECVNTQNPLGFHLADGVVHTYLRGDEYEDISAAWDWNLIPGTTVDYGATALACNQTEFTGVEPFVGGTSDGNIGLAAMRYTNPFTKSLRWQKVWFFLDNDVQHVMIANISSMTSAPVYSVLDQRRHSGAIVTNNPTIRGSKVKTLWHGDVGYVVPISNATTLSVQVGQKTGNWATIGTSTQPPATVDLFTASIQHNTLSTPISYTAFPGTTSNTFLSKSQQLQLQSLRNDASVSAVFDEGQNTTMIVFWDSVGGSATFNPRGEAAVTVSANGNLAIIYKVNSGEVVVSDPSQTLTTVQVTISLGHGQKTPRWGKASSKTLTFALPQGGLAGSSVTQTV